MSVTARLTSAPVMLTENVWAQLGVLTPGSTESPITRKITREAARWDPAECNWPQPGVIINQPVWQWSLPDTLYITETGLPPSQSGPDDSHQRRYRRRLWAWPFQQDEPATVVWGVFRREDTTGRKEPKKMAGRGLILYKGTMGGAKSQRAYQNAELFDWYPL